MKPIDFKGSNFTFNKKNEDGYRPLPVFRGIFNGAQGCVSCWEISDEELEYLNENRRIYISVVGHQVPILPLAQELTFAKSIDDHEIYYESSIIPVTSAWVRVVGEFTPPISILIDGIECNQSSKYRPRKAAAPIKPGDLLFRMPSVEEADHRFWEIELHALKLSESQGQPVEQIIRQMKVNCLNYPS